MKKIGISCMLVLCGLAFAAPASASGSRGVPDPPCELHVFTTGNYAGVFFHAANGRPNGNGVTFDLVLSPVEGAGEKARKSFDVAAQKAILSDAATRSGKFPAFQIITHNPLPADQAVGLDVKGGSIGTEKRLSDSANPCYAEMHIVFLTVYRTALTKMLMTGFVLRYFPSDPAASATKVIASRLNRGEERVGLPKFDFAKDAITAQEVDALSQAFRFMSDRFLRKKVAIFSANNR